MYLPAGLDSSCASYHEALIQEAAIQSVLGALEQLDICQMIVPVNLLSRLVLTGSLPMAQQFVQVNDGMP